MDAATGGPNVKWGTRISNGEGTTGSPAGGGPERKVPVCLWLEHDLVGRVAARSNQGRNDEGLGAQFPRRRKVLTMSQELQCSKFASERPQVRT